MDNPILAQSSGLPLPPVGSVGVGVCPPVGKFVDPVGTVPVIVPTAGGIFVGTRVSVAAGV